MNQRTNNAKVAMKRAAKAAGSAANRAARTTGKAAGKAAKAAGHAAKVGGEVFAAALFGNGAEEALSVASHDTLRDVAQMRGDSPLRDGGRKDTGPREGYSIPDADILRLLKATANAVWKLKGRMIDVETNEPKEEFRKVWRHVETIADALSEIGVETIDWTGRRYDDGMSLKVIAEEESEGAKTPEIAETLLPTIRFRNEERGIQAEIQKGEVVVRRPAGKQEE